MQERKGKLNEFEQKKSVSDFELGEETVDQLAKVDSSYPFADLNLVFTPIGSYSTAGIMELPADGPIF